MNPYKVLEVLPSATHEEIRKSYRRLARKYHPDSNPDDKEASEKFKEIADAYSILGDEEKRAKYDASVNQKKDSFSDSKTSTGNAGSAGAKFSKSDIWNQFFYGGNPFGENPLNRDKESKDSGAEYGYGADKKSANQQFMNFFGFKPKSK